MKKKLDVQKLAVNILKSQCMVALALFYAGMFIYALVK